MLQTIGLENFRAFKKLNDIEIKPITVLCGTNSSGKSTLIKTILMWMQTLESNQPGFAFNGKYFKFGPVKNLPFNNEKNREIKFKFTITTDGSAVTKRYGLLIRTLLEIHRIRGRIERIPKCEFNFSFGFKLNPASEFGIDITSYHLKVKKIDEVIPNALDEQMDKIIIRPLEVKIFPDSSSSKYQVTWKNLPFQRVRMQRMRSVRQDDEEYKELQRTIKKGTLILESWERSVIFSIPRPSLSNFENYNDYVVALELHDITLKVESILNLVFSGFFYLGPMRDVPQRRIFDEGEYKGDMGIRGENAAFILDRYKTTRVNYFYFDTIHNEFNSRRTTFRLALDYWLNELGIHNFKLSKIRDEIFELILNASEYSEHKVNITDVGFGVGQVVPIIIHGLLLNKHSTLMIEQPELHLHPKMQMKLADFFLGLALSEKRFILETHSEHIINRLVRRAVEDSEKKLNHLVGINFVSKTKNGSEIEEVVLTESDGIVNWPDEFFDQAADEQEKIMTAIIQKK